MTLDRWTRIERIYHAALELPARDRDTFVRQEAAGDAELVAEIEALLAYDARPAAFMQHSAMELAARTLAAHADPPERATPTTIGTYEILRPLGAGGMGDVYLARDNRLSRKVALKVLRPDLADSEWTAAFRHEALAASALNHPNIVTIYEIGEHDRASFIAAEYVDGITLRDRLKQGPIATPELVDIAIQIAEGLATAHEAGVVHRDIKPDNVMLRGDGLVKILDFGIATRTGTDLPLALAGTSGSDGVVIGTRGYMSPEQRRGVPVDARTDVWSLGVVLYEMATRRLPAAGVALDDPAQLPPELARLVQRALSTEPGERYATAAEMARDLRTVRHTLGEAGRTRATAVRKLSWLAGAGLVLAAIITAYFVVGERNGVGDTSDPVAYQLYVKGRYHVLRRTPDDLQKGLEYLREAVARDPNYARAHARIADAYILRAMTSDVAPRESFPQARAAAERALAVDPWLSEARVSMGIIKFWFDWDWSGAEAEFKRAIAAQPPDPAAHTFYGHLLSNLGDHTRALQEMRRALDYEPHSALVNALYAQCLYYEGRYDESLAHLQRTLELDPSLWLTHNMMGRIYGWKGRHHEALLAFNKAGGLGGSLVVKASIGYTLAASGKPDDARTVLSELETRAAQSYVPPTNLALVHVGLGEHDKALDRLEEAAEARDMLLTFLTVEPRWSALAGYPRFTALLEKVGLKK